MALSASPTAPSASNCPASSTIDTRCGFKPLTADATKCRMALICCGSRAPRTRTTIEADGSGVLARKQRPLGQYQMDAGGLDAIDGADGAGKFALKRAQMV